ncbi:MAG: hypothetical protein N2560_05350 [Ignavibacteria bacterium]|nr:hypothetical protein [Ignavibacteria bacterium]
MNFHKILSNQLAVLSENISFNIKDITDSDFISKPYKQFIINEIERQFLELSNIIKTTPFLNFNIADNITLLNDFLNSLKRQVVLSTKDLENFLLNALKLRYNFLLKPCSTLLYFVFGDSLNKTKDEILFLISYFSDYEQVVRTVRDEIEAFATEVISVYEFNRLFEDKVSEFFNTSSLEEILEFFEPLFEIHSEGESLPSFEIFCELFRDLGLKNFANIVKGFSIEQKIKFIDKELLQQMLAQPLKITKEVVEKVEKQFDKFEYRNLINLSTLEPIVFKLPEQIPKIEFDLPSENTLIEESVVAKKEEVKEIIDLISKFESKTNESDFIVAKELDVQSPTKDDEDLATSEKLLENSLEFEQQIENTSEFSDLEFPKSEILSSEISDLDHLDLKEEKYSGATISVEESDEEAKFQAPTSEDSALGASELLENELANLSLESQDSSEVSSIEIANAEATFPLFNQIVDEEKKKQFIEELFYTMEEEYNNLVANIDNSKNFDEAMAFVNSYFNEFGIFPEMPIAKEFIDFVKKKFS